MVNEKMRKGKVCHLTSVHPRYDTRIFIKECQSLENNGYDVCLIVADGLGNEVKNNIKIFDVGKPRGRYDRFLNISNRVLKKALELNCDVYHFHDPELVFVGSRLLKTDKKVIYDVHEDVPRQILTKPYIHFVLKKAISFVVEKIECRIAKKFTHVITSTEHIQKRFLLVNINTTSIHNYPFLKEFPSLDTNWEEKEDVVCYIGGISEVRGNYENIEALALIEKRMLLAGVFLPVTYKSKLIKNKGWKFVDFLGFLNREEIIDVLGKSKVGLVTLHPTINYLDSLPVKMFEYMAAGIPVIASDFKLWKTIIEDEKCGVCVDPLNVKEIASAMKELIENDEKAQLMGANGRKAIKQKYNWESEQEELLKIYKNL
ncbi:glycosyltransferase family 4 protein [Pseudozobellia sp. WGM2]|uniref:glycosyltransferase family 4 protein n=1 Tax=Pseudozobellia sp. WGM2 TaxID=2787625 RepID=UPI001AE0C1B0|nr:glycosyltransferase family 4 protein [Pseudozobellia sp. WGM2]